VNSQAGLSVDEIAAKTKAAPELLGMQRLESELWLTTAARLLRYLSSVSIVAQSSPDRFFASPSCHLYASPLGIALMTHAFDSVSPAVLALPSFLIMNNHQNIVNIRETPFQQAFHTSLPVFEYLRQPGREKQYDGFQKSMTAMQNSDWLNMSLVDGTVQQDVMFVDVAGGGGHQCIKLSEKYPSLKGHAVLEDLHQTTDGLEPIEGVKIIAQDFFEEQAVKGSFSVEQSPC
jgi:demethylsterigmatocystin 6-O-methyltransferase